MTTPSPAAAADSPEAQNATSVLVLVVSRVSNIWGAERRLLDIAPLLAHEGIHLTLGAPPGKFADAWVLASHAWVSLDLDAHQGLRRPGSRQRPGIRVDLLVRRGIVSLVLFVVAIALTLSDSFLAWRRHRDRYVAVLGFACGTALVGLLVKGMVELLFEKFRLATLLGLLIGAIIATASAMRETNLESR